MMESEMPRAAQLVASRHVPALLRPFSFGLDFHAFVLKLLQDHHWLWSDRYFGAELGAAAVFHAYYFTEGKQLVNNWLTFNLVFFSCVGVHGDLDVYKEGGICACERCQAYKIRRFFGMDFFWPTIS